MRSRPGWTFRGLDVAAGGSFAEAAVAADQGSARHFSKGHGLVRKGGQTNCEAIYQFMIAPQAEFSIVAKCRVLRVSSSGYYAWLRRPKQSRLQQADTKLLVAIRAIYVASRRLYGARRIQGECHKFRV